MSDASHVLLGTKLFVPTPRPSSVPRPRLVEHLNRGLVARLILVSAPAGFGKTTLLAEWLQGQPDSACWLSLDAADNDPARFLSYLVAALQTASPGAGQSLLPMFHTPQPPPLEAALVILLNDLCTLSRDLLLVLDDYHVITAPAISAAVTFLLEHLPPQVHLVIATRSDPSLPLARFRSRGQLLEVRADSLRFTAEEAATFLNQLMGLSLSEEQIAALEERTEGWIAGLQMAALSMRDRQGVAAFVAAFTGTHRFILDFLVEEVLAREPEPIRSFLLQTSVLERLTGPLCNAVTGQEDGQEMLERLEQANLFVVPLDDERRWYRYHHLFADVLLNQLGKAHPNRAPTLHVRASDWYESEGLADLAIRHAIASPDWKRAARLVGDNWLPVGHRGQVATVLRWLDALPNDFVTNDAMLSAAYAWMLFLMGKTEGVERHLDDADRALAHPQARDGTESAKRAWMLSGIAALRSHLAHGRGAIGQALRYAEESLALAPEDSALMRGHAYGALAHAYLEIGETDRSLEALVRGVELTQRAGNTFAAAAGTFHVARVQRLRGRLREAEKPCRDALERSAASSLALTPGLGMVHLAMAFVLVEQGQLGDAERHLLPMTELAKHAASPDVSVSYGVVLARVRRARGAINGALAALDEAMRKVSEADMPLSAALLAARRAALLLALGRLSEAERWADSAANRAGDDRGYTREQEALAIAHVRLATGQPAEATSRLTECLDLAKLQGRHGSAIEMLVLRAIARNALGDTAEALSDLGRALALAEPEGYVQSFLDEGEVLIRLLHWGLGTGSWSAGATRHAERLIARSHEMQSARSTPPDEEGPRQPRIAGPLSRGLVEPLSNREIEVLSLVAQGCSNQEIAERLVITLNTVKKHTSNVFGKLGVTSRTQAVARGRELGLV